MDLPGRLSPSDARLRAAETEGHSDEAGRTRHERRQGRASGAVGDLPSAPQLAHEDGGSPSELSVATGGLTIVAEGYPLVENLGLVRVPDVSCRDGHGLSQPNQGSQSRERTLCRTAGPREHDTAAAVASPARTPWTEGGEAHAQALGAHQGQGQPALRMRTPSRHLRQTPDRTADSCAAQDAGPAENEGVFGGGAGSAEGTAAETVPGARTGAMAASASSASPGSAPGCSATLPSSATPGVAALPSSSHVSPLALLTRHLRPGPLLLCFFLGLGLGLVLTEPQERVGADLASLENDLLNVARPSTRGLEATSEAATGSWDQAASWAQGRNPERADRAGQGMVNESVAAQALEEPPSAEQRALDAVGARGVGHCAAYHGMDVASLKPGSGRLWPLLLIVTPTYVRPFQAMYLRRLANLLRLVPPPVLWIVVEIGQQSTETATLLRTTGLQTRHIVTAHELLDIKDRGVNQRNAALEYIEEHRLDGIVYFADDDNVYSPALFHEIRKVRYCRAALHLLRKQRSMEWGYLASRCLCVLRNL